MGLIRDVGRGKVGLDSAVFIYLLEEHEVYLPVIEPLFREIDARRREAVTSAVTLLEVLVVPYRAGDLDLVNRYEALLTRSRGLEMVGIDREQLKAAALLRANYRIRTPDALQVTAALSGGCSAFVTNDRDLPEIPTLRVLQLRDYVSA
ncbi:MAG: type II toxin-antitoxin system VapC family toxin [Planctomycetes bacterium]|nr:type II toxin-antitoxin system VapC family toxin [Planctomycetota bacterium]